MATSRELAVQLRASVANSKYHEPERDLRDVYERLELMSNGDDPDLRPLHPVMVDMIAVLLDRIDELEHAINDENDNV